MGNVKIEEIRKWLRKMYSCHWSYADNMVTIICDNEEFHIRPDRLEVGEKLMLKKYLNNKDMLISLQHN